VSERVRDQYAEDPYPRWVTVARRPAATLEAALSAQLGRPVAVPGPRPIEVLVCGCGTGQHALTAAARASDVTVLGVDLSRPSLGRAAIEPEPRPNRRRLGTTPLTCWLSSRKDRPTQSGYTCARQQQLAS
jgi:SAM-dependent methyltransferase